MSNLSFQFRPPAFDTHCQPAPAEVDEGLERFALLVPACRASPRNLQTYALAYIEHFTGDVPQLEHEQKLLYAALLQAWQRAEYGAVIALAEGLAYLAGRFRDKVQAQQALHLGIEASRRTRDTRRQVTFLNRLGSVLFAGGKYSEGLRAWYEGLQLAESTRCPQQFWHALASFASIVDIAGRDPLVKQCLETYPPEMPDEQVVLLFGRGFRARVSNDSQRACEDLAECLRLLAHVSGTTAHKQLFTMVAQAELARAQGNYARSQAYTESALALAQLCSDHYTLLALLFDQTLFTYQQGQLSDAYSAFLRLRDVGRLMQTPQVVASIRLFERLLPASPVGDNNSLERNQETRLLPSSPFPYHQEPLSERELEVLRLVAEGYTSRDIAARLVITPGTVKKHLEHIYTRLDVHNRTSAIARARTLHILP